MLNILDQEFEEAVKEGGDAVMSNALAASYMWVIQRWPDATDPQRSAEEIRAPQLQRTCHKVCVAPKGSEGRIHYFTCPATFLLGWASSF